MVASPIPLTRLEGESKEEARSVKRQNYSIETAIAMALIEKSTNPALDGQNLSPKQKLIRLEAVRANIVRELEGSPVFGKEGVALAFGTSLYSRSSMDDKTRFILSLFNGTCDFSPILELFNECSARGFSEKKREKKEPHSYEAVSFAIGAVKHYWRDNIPQRHMYVIMASVGAFAALHDVIEHGFIPVESLHRDLKDRLGFVVKAMIENYPATKEMFDHNVYPTLMDALKRMDASKVHGDGHSRYLTANVYSSPIPAWFKPFDIVTKFLHSDSLSRCQEDAAVEKAWRKLVLKAQHNTDAHLASLDGNSAQYVVSSLLPLLKLRNWIYGQTLPIPEAAMKQGITQYLIDHSTFLDRAPPYDFMGIT